MDATELAFAGIARQAELIRAKEVSSRELVDLYLERIERLDPELNAYRTVYADEARAAADEVKPKKSDPAEQPLLGVPIAVKDELDVAGDHTGHGTEAYGPPAVADSEIVRRLRAAGAVVLGKTHLSELAMWPFTLSNVWGTTRNPWDTQRTPGGSSGGSAAAVAAGLAPAATASDGGGSIRVPATCCGLFGLKPQRGRISLMPEAEHWHGLSVSGTVTRSVLDTALYLDVVAGPAPGDADTPPAPERPYVESARAAPGKLRIALSLRPALLAAVRDDQKRAVHETADVLRGLGHEVVERNPAYGQDVLPRFLPRYLGGLDQSAAMLARPERFERRTRDMVRLGRLARGRAAWARAGEQKVAARVNRIFDNVDVILSPVTAEPALELDRVQGRGTARTFAEAANFVAFCPVWNLTGQPAASVPAGFRADGVPLSVQLVGRPNDEATVLSLAAQIEAERPWAHRRPPVS